VAPLWHHLEREGSQLLARRARRNPLPRGRRGDVVDRRLPHRLPRHPPSDLLGAAAVARRDLPLLRRLLLRLRGVDKVERSPVDLSVGERLDVVGGGFGGFLALGGGAIDRFVLRTAGVSEREAQVRVTLLAGLEHGVLVFPASAAAIYVLAIGHSRPAYDFTILWAIAPWIGFAVAFWAAERYRDRFHDRSGWRGELGILLDTAHLVRTMFRQPLCYAESLGGMLLFWLCDVFALWAAMAAFGFRMNGAPEMVAFGTAMIVTRRTGPLAGAGILMAAPPQQPWQSGAPWVPAMLGVFAYRFFILWLPLPFSFLAIPRLRDLGRQSGEPPPKKAEEEEGEPALQR
jgi:hypothetical protein